MVRTTLSSAATRCPAPAPEIPRWRTRSCPSAVSMHRTFSRVAGPYRPCLSGSRGLRRSPPRFARWANQDFDVLTYRKDDPALQAHAVDPLLGHRGLEGRGRAGQAGRAARGGGEHSPAHRRRAALALARAGGGSRPPARRPRWRAEGRDLQLLAMVLRALRPRERRRPLVLALGMDERSGIVRGRRRGLARREGAGLGGDDFERIRAGEDVGIEPTTPAVPFVGVLPKICGRTHRPDLPRPNEVVMGKARGLDWRLRGDVVCRTEIGVLATYGFCGGGDSLYGTVIPAGVSSASFGRNGGIWTRSVSRVTCSSRPEFATEPA